MKEISVVMKIFLNRHEIGGNYTGDLKWKLRLKTAAEITAKIKYPAKMRRLHPLILHLQRCALLTKLYNYIAQINNKTSYVITVWQRYVCSVFQAISDV